MNIDELTKNIKKVSPEKGVQDLADFIEQWKAEEKNAVDLGKSVERYLGNVWIEKQADFEKIYRMWSDFRDSAIDNIGGMTMNERLYWFGLFDQFDKASNDSEQKKFYDKLMAKK